MGILKNENDSLVDKNDVEVLLLNQPGASLQSKNITVYTIANKLNITLKRAKEIAEEACNHGVGFATRVHRYPEEPYRYGLRW